MGQKSHKRLVVFEDFAVESTHPFHPLLQLVVDEEGQVLGRAGVQVEEVLKVTGDGLFEEPVVVERLLEEAVEARLQIQQTLAKREKK